MPKLDVRGAQLCVAARSDVDGALRTERCGVELNGDPVQLELHASPRLLSPSEAAPFTDTTQFEWSAFDDGISILELTTSTPTASTPIVHVFTAGTTFDARKLPAESVDFARSAYQVVVLGAGPFKDLNAAVGINGLAAPLRAESRFAKAVSRTLTPAR